MTDWSKLKVAELKEELKTRGVPLTGLKLKADFVAKLEELDASAIGDEDEKNEEKIAASEDSAAEPELEQPIDEACEEPVVTKNGVPEEDLRNGKLEEQEVNKKPVELLANTVLPEMVDMYSSSQIKPTPSQPLTEILATKEDAKVEPAVPSTPPVVKVDGLSSTSSPVPTTELIEDSRKRKRRSVTPPPSTQDVALKKAKARDGTPVITKQESSLEKIQAATDAAEAIQAPDGLGDNVPIKEDVPGTRGEADTKPSQLPGDATGNEQAALRSPSREESALVDLNRNDVEPSMHPATSSLYLRNFKRPLQGPILRKHLTDIARSPSDSSENGPITLFHLDNIRTHALVSFNSVGAAAKVRLAMHNVVFPDEASRMPIWVDFVPDDKIEAWITKEASSNDRNKKWEVTYHIQDSVEAIHHEVEAGGLSHKPIAVQPRYISISEALSRPPPSTAPGIHPDRTELIPRQEQNSYDLGIPSRPEAKPPAVPESDIGTGFKALDELFSSTTTKPKLYYKAVSPRIAEDRLHMIKDLRVGHSEMGKSGDEGMKRYSFEVYSGREEWVDKGPEFGYGRRGVDALEGRRGRGGAYRGGRGDRGRGGDSWRGRY